jgi:hypothetical protein
MAALSKAYYSRRFNTKIVATWYLLHPHPFIRAAFSYAVLDDDEDHQRQEGLM